MLTHQVVNLTAECQSGLSLMELLNPYELNSKILFHLIQKHTKEAVLNAPKLTAHSVFLDYEWNVDPIILNHKKYLRLTN